jgi:hypothetical protein
VEEVLSLNVFFPLFLRRQVEPVDKQFQYILVAAEPYETIAFKVPNR